MRSNSEWCVAAVLFFAIGGCGGSSDSNPSGGDGGGSDSAAQSDTATGLDSGTGFGSETGATPGLDGSAALDGPAPDGSSLADGSSAPESGTGPDGASGVEGGGVASGVHAVGDQIYDGSKVIRLLGVDETGSQYACIQGDGFFDPTTGGANSMTSITAMLAWGVNAVRIPLNEDCWLSLNPTAKNMAYFGTAYQTAIQTYVNLLLANDIYPIVELHWTEGPGGSAATGQQPMPDAAHGADFWTSVANMFKSQNKVVFDLFNEPYPDNNMDATSAWQCWGATTTSSCPGVTYEIVGMAGMLAAVRNTGATNLVLMGGIEYSNDLTQWLTYAPTDTNIGASWHVYTDNPYKTAAAATPLLAKVPIVATEIGDATNPPTCTGAFVSSIMDILDAPGTGFAPQSYLAWSWSTDNTPALLSSYNPVTPTCDGPTVMAHLMAQK